MESFIIKPILGLKSNTAADDHSLFQMIGDNAAATHCVDMRNVDIGRTRNVAAKSTGKSQYSNAANASAALCLGLFELVGSSATDHIYFDNGAFYYLNASREFTAIAHSVPVTMANGAMDLYSMIQVGDYIVWADRAEHQPYMWKNGDANFANFIKTGTAYKFRFLTPFQRRVIGAYSDQTDGDIEIRWTQDWTTANYFTTACTFAAANQLYKPGNDPITGLKTFGSNACFLYGESSIDSINYYPNYTTPFAITNMVGGHGATNHHSIVDIGYAHLLFNKHYGFVEYRGGSQFPYGGRPISEDIEDLIATINPAYHEHIVGVFIPNKNEVCWTVPLEGSATPNYLLFYDVLRKHWRIKDFSARYLDYWTLYSSTTWTDLINQGYTTWSALGNLTWSVFASSSSNMALGNTNGHLYNDTSEADASADFTGYRTEPIMDFGAPANKDLLLEIWFNIAAIGNYSLFVYHRGGDTVGECKTAAWVALDEVSCNSPDTAVVYLNQNHRFHQIKWGTDGANEPFEVSAIEFKYVRQGRY